MNSCTDVTKLSTQMSIHMSIHSLLHFYLSHMAYHHHPPYHLHDHHSHLFLLVLSFILNLRLGSLPNHFLHRPSPFLPDWFHGHTDHLTFYSAQRLDLFAWCVRLSRLLVGFRTHFSLNHCTFFFFFFFFFFYVGYSMWTVQVHFQNGDYIIRQGAIGDTFYVIVRGKVITFYWPLSIQLHYILQPLWTPGHFFFR